MPHTIANDCEYRAARAIYEAFEAWRDGRSGYRTEDIPEYVTHPSNDMRSAIEEWEWRKNPPDRALVYVNVAEPEGSTHLGGRVTTWTGQFLAGAFVGPSYRSNMGDRRRAIEVWHPSGVVYSGTYFCGAGDYARIRKTKRHWRGEKVLGNKPR